MHFDRVTSHSTPCNVSVRRLAVSAPILKVIFSGRNLKSGKKGNEF